MNGTDSLRAFISGCEGLTLSSRELSFFRETRPCGLILFKRNCGTPHQVRALTDSYREAVDDAQALVLIDQEGGRVQRLQPPHWRQYPPAQLFAQYHARDPEAGLVAARLCARLIARDLHELGVTVNCAPVADLPVPGAHDVIGDRAYGATPDAVIALARAVANGYLNGGVLPVLKHIPGHGRAGVDSHKSLPVIECERAELAVSDFLPFRALADLPLGMTAHILIPAIDPEAPSSASSTIISDIIRSEIGFDGLLMCDDLGMNALAGNMKERARAVLAAGCDLALHCSGIFAEMEDVASQTPLLSGDALRRFNSALGRLKVPQAFDEDHAERLLAATCDNATS
ncbi:MAG: beta-N-acetylhexosaminidase [Hyphomicrobiales bacterium]|nr:beta-N-acetylhexosaminidase [Hyphomicrobiales bacterium]